MGSEAVGGTLVPLLFLCLGGMLYEGIAFSLFFAQSPVELLKYESAFFVTLKPKDPGPNKWFGGPGLDSPQLIGCLIIK